MKKFQSSERSGCVKWRPPRSNWWSSPLSPNDDDMKQRWHKRYGRLGRRYETQTPQGPSVAEDYSGWESGYRHELEQQTWARRGPRNLANRRIPTYNFRPPSHQETRADDQVLDVDAFLGKTRTPQPPSDGARSSSDGAPGASGSAVVEQEGTRPRQTAAQKGKWREGEPPRSAIGPSALKTAVPKDHPSLAAGMPARGLRVIPRPHSPGDEENKEDEEDEDRPHVEQVEHAESTYALLASAVSKAAAAAAKIEAGNQLARFRLKAGFAAELPLDGLGVVRDRTSLRRHPLPRSKYSSSSAMQRRQSQMGVPGPSSQAGSVMMERTQSQPRVPDPSSQDYADMVAESNKRLEELSPYTPDGRVADTPMPDLEEGTDDREPTPLSSLPSSPLLLPSQRGGHVPRLGAPVPYRAPILQAKRGASEISGGYTPGPSRHRQAPKPAGSSMTVATMSANGQERRISYNELRAIGLQPPPSVQKELCKLYCVLVQVVQVATAEFSVVDPHDFIEVLSWSDSVAAGDTQVVRRLREQVVTPLGARKKLLIPFSLEGDMFLALVDFGAELFMILDQRAQEDLQTREQDDGFETSSDIYEFVHTLFPDGCPSLRTWTILFKRTPQDPEPINQPGIVCGRYVNELGRSIPLRSILPFFFEVSRILSKVQTRVRVDDVALLKRLFALFEGAPRLNTSEVFLKLREDSKKMLRNVLEGWVDEVLAPANKEFRIAVASTRPDVAGHCTPRQLLYLKLALRNHIPKTVAQSHSAVAELFGQHSQTRIMLEGIMWKCMMSKTGVHHTMLSKLSAGWFDWKDGRRQV